MVKKFLFLFVLLLAVTGCFSRFEKMEVVQDPTSTISVPKGFSFQMSKSVNVVVSHAKLAKTDVALYDGSGTLIEKGMFNKSGKYQTKITLKSTTENLILKSVNFKNPINLAIVNDGVEYNISDNEINTKIKSSAVKREIETSEELRTQYYPGYGKYGTLAFEDKWPEKGDYDCNDLVINYNYTLEKELAPDGSTNISKIIAKFIPTAAGAGYSNGFGIQLNIGREKIERVTGYENEGLESPALEENQEKPVIIVFNDAKRLFGENSQDKMYNTNKNEQYVGARAYTVTITFVSGTKLTDLQNGLMNGKTPFNPFIFRTGQRGIEVHLKGEEPTSAASPELFNTKNDKSNIIRYSTQNGMPWAMDIPNTFSYPVERASIVDAYKKFQKWIESNGVECKDWYMINNGKDGYFDFSKIYKREELSELGTPQNLRITKKTATTMKLAWDKVDGAISYKIYKKYSGEGAFGSKRGLENNSQYREVGTSGTNEFDVTGLYGGENCTFAVTASDGFMESEYSDTVSDITMLDKPVDLTLSGVTNNCVTLTWNVEYLRYFVYRSTDNLVFTQIGDINKDGFVLGKTIFEDKDVISGIKYYYKIEGIDPFNETMKTEMSDAIIATTLFDLKVRQATGNLIELFWEASAEKYRILRSSDGITYSEQATINEKEYKDSNVENSKVYFYKVVLLDKEREISTSLPLKVKASNIDIPEGLQIVKAEPSKIYLKWEIVEKSEKYLIYRCKDKVNFAKIGETSESAFVDGALDGSTRYYYKIKAVRGAFESDFSEMVEMATPSSGEMVIPENIKVISENEIKNNLKAIDAYGMEFYANKKLLNLKRGQIITGMVPEEQVKYFGKAFFREILNVRYDESTGVIFLETQNGKFDDILEGNYTSKEEFQFSPKDVKITINPEYAASNTTAKLSRGSGSDEMVLELLNIKFSDKDGNNAGEASGKLFFKPGIVFAHSGEEGQLIASGSVRFEAKAKYRVATDGGIKYDGVPRYKKIDFHKVIRIGEYTYGTWVAPFIYAYATVPLDLVVDGTVAGGLDFYFSTPKYTLNAGVKLSKNGFEYLQDFKEEKVDFQKDNNLTMFMNGKAKVSLETGVFLGLYFINLADICIAPYLQGNITSTTTTNYPMEVDIELEYYMTLKSGIMIDMGLNRGINALFKAYFNIPDMRKVLYNPPEKVLINKKMDKLNLKINKKTQLEWNRIKLVNTSNQMDYMDYAPAYFVYRAKWIGTQNQAFEKYKLVDRVEDNSSSETMTLNVEPDEYLYKYRVVAMARNDFMTLPGPDSNIVLVRKAEFEDKNFENAIREKIGKPDGVLIASDLDALITIPGGFDFSNKGIKSIKGLENLGFSVGINTGYYGDIPPIGGGNSNGNKHLDFYSNEIESLEWQAKGLDGKEHKFSAMNLTTINLDLGGCYKFDNNKIKMLNFYTNSEVYDLVTAYWNSVDYLSLGYESANNSIIKYYKNYYKEPNSCGGYFRNNEIESVNFSSEFTEPEIALYLENNKIKGFQAEKVKRIYLNLEKNPTETIDIKGVGNKGTEYYGMLYAKGLGTLNSVTLSDISLSEVDFSENGRGNGSYAFSNFSSGNLNLTKNALVTGRLTFANSSCEVINLADNNLASGACLSGVNATSVSLQRNGIKSLLDTKYDALKVKHMLIEDYLPVPLKYEIKGAGYGYYCQYKSTEEFDYMLKYVDGLTIGNTNKELYSEIKSPIFVGENGYNCFKTFAKVGLIMSDILYSNNPRWIDNGSVLVTR